VHEMPVTQSIFDIVTEYAREHNAERVRRVTVVIGNLTGVVEDSVRFYWESLTKGTIAENAELVVVHVPLKVRCYGCGTEYEADDQFAMFCPSCNFFGGEVLSGKELYVDTIEVEGDSHAPSEASIAEPPGG
jgi:hydrogenase nickel incorporation protein HypA/HybF